MKISQCQECKREMSKYTKAKKIRTFCSRKCATSYRYPKYTKPCPICGKPMIQYLKRKDNKMFCSRKCTSISKKESYLGRHLKTKTRQKMSQKRIKFFQTKAGKEEAKKSSQRMLKNNPMSNSKTVEKMKATKKENGTFHLWIGKRGGNGQFTKPQKKLWNLLEDNWQMELVISTKRKSPYPYNYKVDIGNRKLKIGIEIDGKGHRMKKAMQRDAKKQNLLQSLGWKILRFTNEEVMTNPLKVLLEIENYTKIV